MNEIVISVEKLGKKYSIRHQRNGAGGYQTFREALADSVRKPFQRLRNRGRSKIEDGSSANVSPTSNSQLPTSRTSKEDFWALKGVSFEVRRGEVLGIIGRNGAGKSTLLKILSRITDPTEGKVRIKGRVASLLEVGTGFHPELTGRENIFLNGAILGMAREEIKKKFDEIVDFAEIEKFLDTPVKRYSSGMYVRLAFSVAAHLEPDILIVDEVLAVGDIAFQKKCVDRIALQTAKQDATVIVVSHNLATIKTLCSRGLFLHHGNMIRFGAVNEVCDEYYRLLNRDIRTAIPKTRLAKSGEATIFDCWLGSSSVRLSEIHLPQTIEIQIVLDVHKDCFMSFEATLKDSSSRPVAFIQYGLTSREPPLALQVGRHELSFKLPDIELAVGKYTIDLSACEPMRKSYDSIEDALAFETFASSDTLTGWSFEQSTQQGAVLLNCSLVKRP